MLSKILLKLRKFGPSVILASFTFAIPIIFTGLQVFAAAPATTPSTGSAGSNSAYDLNLLPKYKNLIQFLELGVLPFLLSLSPVVATLAIVWGGYKYYFGSFTGKEDGLKAVQAGIIGLAITSGYSIVVKLLESTITPGKPGETASLNAQPLIDFLGETILNDFLFALAGVVAVLALVYGGYQYIASPLQKEDGLKTIQNAITGLVVILIAQPIKNLVTGSIDKDAKLGAVLNKEPLLKFINDIVTRFLLPVSSVVTVFFLVLAGYQWITSQGDSRKVEDAQKNLRNSIIGLVVVILSFTITQLVTYLVLNFNLGGGK